MLGPDDAVLSDELNHASIIDGIRLCRAKRLRYKHMDLSDLETKLKESEVCGLLAVPTLIIYLKCTEMISGVICHNSNTIDLTSLCCRRRGRQCFMMIKCKYTLIIARSSRIHSGITHKVR